MCNGNFFGNENPTKLRHHQSGINDGHALSNVCGIGMISLKGAEKKVLACEGEKGKEAEKSFPCANFT